MRRTNRITGIEGVNAGGNASVSLPIGVRYHKLKFFCYVAGVLTAVDDVVNKVRLVVNGRGIRELTAAQLVQIAQLNGLSPIVGEIPIFFSEPWRASVMGEESTSWDMHDQSSFKVELELKSPVGAITIRGVREFDRVRNLDQDKKPALFIVSQRVNTYTLPAGERDITNLPITFPIQRLLIDSAGVINSVKVDRDDEKVYEMNLAENEAALADADLAASAFAFPVVFDLTQQITDALEIRRTLNLKVEAAAGQEVAIITEATAPGYI